MPLLQKELKCIDKKMGENGRVLLRYSGTENMARVMIEGKDEVLVEESCLKLVDIIKKELS